MLTLNKKTYYAIEAVLYIAYHAKVQPISGNAVAAAQHLPTRYLEPMMQKLVRAGILRGVRGPQGGYMLGRERRHISLHDIAQSISKDAALPASNTTLGNQVLVPHTRSLLGIWQGALSSVTLAQLYEQAEKASITADTTTPNNFTI